METQGNKTLWQPIAEELSSQGFEISDCIAESTNSILLKGKQVLMGRDVAVKVLSNSAGQTGEAYERFQQEIKLLGSFEHPNIVKLFGAGQLSDGRTYMTMEFVDGVSLADLLKKQGTFTESQVRLYGAQICRALAYSHAKQIIHRDLKPANVMVQDLNGESIIKLIDFGIHKATADTGQQQLTQAGSFAGTANYMSPEQCRSAPVDSRSDIYSLGCMLYEFCCGEAPMFADSDWAILSNHLNKEITQIPARSPISKQLKDAILRCLRKDPAERWADMESVQAVLEAKFESQSKNRLSVPLLACIAIFAFVLASLYFVLPMFKSASKLEVNTDTTLNLPWESFTEKPKNKGPNKIERSRLWLEVHIDQPSSLVSLANCFDECDPLNWTEGQKYYKLIWSKANDGLKEKLYQKPSNHLRLYDLYAIKQDSAFRMKDYAACESALAEAMKDGNPEDRTIRWISFEKLLTQYLQENKKGKVIALFETYKNHMDGSGEFRAKILEWMSSVYTDLGEKAKAEECVNLIFDNYAACPKLEEYESFQHFCAVQNILGHQKKVARLAKGRFNEHIENEMQALACIEIAKANQYVQDFKTADRLIANLKASSFTTSSNTVPDQLLALELASAVFVENNKLAREKLEIILDKLKTSTNSNFVLLSCLERVCGRFPELTKLCDPVLSTSDPQYGGYVYASTGHRFRSENKIKEALRDYGQSQKYFAKCKDYIPGRVSVYIGQASCFQALGEWAKAEECIRLAKKYLRKDDQEGLKFRIEARQASLLLSEGKFAEAESLQEKILTATLPLRHKFPADFSSAVWDLFSYHRNYGDKAKALELVNKYLPKMDRSNIYVEQTAKQLIIEKANILKENPSLKVGK